MAGELHHSLTRRGAVAGHVAALSLALLLPSCAVQPRWHTSDVAIERDAARLFRPEGAAGAPRDPYAGEIAEVPIRKNMRPCCAFGAQIHVRVGPVPVPLYFVGNLVDRRRIRHHVYDSGNSTFGSRGAGPEVIHREGNGLVYTCKSGFLDIAHVRDYADTALYTITTVARHLETGGDFALPDEGAKVTIQLRPVDEATLSGSGRWSIAIPLGQWLAFQSGLWHEIATWFGWSTFALFPERVSAFSPEDLYSNLLGVRIAAAVVSQRGARDEFAYNRNVDRWIDRSLELVEAVPVATAEEAMLAVDGIWWDSKKRLPDMSLVLRRNFESGSPVTPWLVPESRFGVLLRAACGEHPQPLPIANPTSMSNIEFPSQATLVIELPDALASQEPFARLGRRITQEDFPAILDFIRKQNAEMFGPFADRPDISPP